MEGFASKGAKRVLYVLCVFYMLYMLCMLYLIYMCAVLDRKSNEMATKQGGLKDSEGLSRVEIES